MSPATARPWRADLHRGPARAPARAAGHRLRASLRLAIDASLRQRGAMTDAQAQLIADVAARFGPRAAVTEPADIEPWLTDWRGRWHGASPAMLQPDSTEAVAAIVALARGRGRRADAAGRQHLDGRRRDPARRRQRADPVAAPDEPHPRDRRRPCRGRGRGDPRPSPRRRRGDRRALPADARRARAARRSAGWCRPMPGARRCFASGRCARWSRGSRRCFPTAASITG